MLPEVARISYFGSLGPTHMDSCADCPDPTPSATNYCCRLGWSFGSLPNSGLGISPGQFPGMICRWPRSVTFSEVRDGLSNTVAVGERDLRRGAGTWVGNRNPWGTCIHGSYYGKGRVSKRINDDDTRDCDTCWEGFSSQHAGGAHFVMCDGSTHTLQQTIDGTLFENLATIAGSEVTVLP